MSDYKCEWSNHHAVLAATAFDFYKENMFTDITLVCDDNQQIQAHKVILSASSPTFNELFGRNELLGAVFFRDVKKDEMASILEFMYTGVTELQESDLPSFLKLAADLQVKELHTPVEQLVPIVEDIAVTTNVPVLHNISDATVPISPQINYQNPEPFQYQDVKEVQAEQDTKSDRDHNGVVCDICHGIYKTPKILKKHKLIHSDMKYSCELCGKTYTRKDVLKIHREVKHPD